MSIAANALSRIDLLGPKALARWGARTQIVKAIEEMGELITVLSKHLNDSPVSMESIIDEIADVIIVAHQMRHLYGGSGVDDRILFKMRRLETRLNDGNTERP